MAKRIKEENKDSDVSRAIDALETLCDIHQIKIEAHPYYGLVFIFGKYRCKITRDDNPGEMVTEFPRQLSEEIFVLVED